MIKRHQPNYINYKVIYLIASLLASNFTVFGQQMLMEKFEKIRDESKKYNEEIAALYYKDTPVALSIARDRTTIDYSKFYIFSNNSCISETVYFPKEDYLKKLQYFKILYGEPVIVNSVTNWLKEDLQITLTVAYSKMHGKEICQINYAYTSSHGKIMDIIEKMQTPYVKRVIIKTNSK
jgi:hypothetical protein